MSATTVTVLTNDLRVGDIIAEQPENGPIIELHKGPKLFVVFADYECMTDLDQPIEVIR